MQGIKGIVPDCILTEVKMFSFFKKKKREDEETTEIVSADNEKKEDDSAISITSGIVIDAAVRHSAEQAKIKYTRPEYNPQNRKAYYDDPSAHKAALERAFSSGESVKDPYTGAELVKKQQDAKIQFGEEWQSHAAEADHIDPLSQIAKRTKKNPFLTIDDVKEIGNADDNFQVLSRKLNQTNKKIGKGGSTQQEWANDPVRMKGVAGNIESGESIDSVSKSIKERGRAAEKRNDRRALNKSIKNAVSTAHGAGMEAAYEVGITTAAMSGIMNIVAVIKGEKSVEDAVGDTVEDTGKAMARGYVTGAGLTSLYRTLSGSSSKFIKALTESNIPGKVITAVIVTGDILKRYGNGEITTQECLIELGDKGICAVTTGYSMAVGQALIPIPIIGAAIGALVGSMATDNYCHQLMAALQTKELEHQERLRIIAESERAAEEARAFRAELEKYLASYFREYQDCFDDALMMINTSFRSGDADGVIAGANKITRKLGGKVHYDNMDEFRDFLFDDSTDVL